MKLQITLKKTEVKKVKKKLQEPIWFFIVSVLLIDSIVSEILTLIENTYSAWNFVEGVFFCFFIYELIRMWKERK